MQRQQKKAAAVYFLAIQKGYGQAEGGGHLQHVQEEEKKG